jgi:formylglycine-generating enzyme required for sulfatase activity
VPAVALLSVVGALVLDERLSIRGKNPDVPTSPAPGTEIVDRLRSGGVAPPMVVIPAGQIRAGEAADGSRVRNWLTGFTAVVPRPIAVARTETTVASFRQFALATGTHVDAGCWYHTVEQEWRLAATADWTAPGFAQTENHPVTCVGYEEGRAYAAWLTRETNQRYRLPTEVEFEFFNRAGRDGPYSFTVNQIAELCGKANGADHSAQFAYAYPCVDGYEFTAPVGSFPPNGFGLYDTTGNVWEVTSDCWHSDYGRAAFHLVRYQPSGENVGGCRTRHVVKGGSFISSTANLRVAKREVEGYRSTRAGFRVVRELP